MPVDHSITAATLDRYRSYLRLIARMHIPSALSGKLDASDLVQDALVKAIQHLGQYRGQTEAELAGWLRQILANTLANATRDLGRDKRDAGREISLEQQIHDSSARIEGLLATDQTSPSVAAVRRQMSSRQGAAMTCTPYGIAPASRTGTAATGRPTNEIGCV